MTQSWLLHSHICVKCSLDIESCPRTYQVVQGIIIQSSSVRVMEALSYVSMFCFPQQLWESLCSYSFPFASHFQLVTSCSRWAQTAWWARKEGRRDAVSLCGKQPTVWASYSKVWYKVQMLWVVLAWSAGNYILYWMKWFDLFYWNANVWLLPPAKSVSLFLIEPTSTLPPIYATLTLEFLLFKYALKICLWSDCFMRWYHEAQVCVPAVLVTLPINQAGWLSTLLPSCLIWLKTRRCSDPECKSEREWKIQIRPWKKETLSETDFLSLRVFMLTLH